MWGFVFLALPVCLAAEESKPVRVYTNEDLERVAPYRDQTGVNSVPAVAPSGGSDAGAEAETPAEGSRRGKRAARASTGGRSTSGRSTSTASGRGEDYWRQEARRVRERVRALRQRATTFNERIEERRRKPKVFPYSDPQIRTWTQRVEEIEAQIREIEGELEERARHAGALPGWTR
jgi:hypothetical protein